MSEPERVESRRSDFAPLTCEIVPERDAVRVRPLGALDLATAPMLAAEVAQLRDAGFRRIVVDLRGLDFIDSSGLRALMALHARAGNDGFDLSLVRGDATVQRVFEVTGTGELLPFTES
jgi:anti-sigma B factor antagonist